MNYSSIEICAGAGGQAIGLEQAGFNHKALIEIEHAACQTLRFNRPYWNVVEKDVKLFSAIKYPDIDLLAGGVPCPPFSIAGKQLGPLDERDLFPEALRLIQECNPKAIMLENVRGILGQKFFAYRQKIIQQLEDLGYQCEWKLINSSDYGVSQLRPRAILVALKEQYFDYFKFPQKYDYPPPTIGELLFDEISSLGWKHASEWKSMANDIAPTLVGGSKKHGGADLGPTRSKLAWSNLGINGKGLADLPPNYNDELMPKITLKMAALVQGFPNDWRFAGKKTSAYRQIGNAFPPPVAKAIGISIISSFIHYDQKVKERFQSKIA